MASALLLLTVTMVTAYVVSVSRAGGRHETVRQADRALGSLAERLGRLSYCAPQLPAPGAPEGARDVLGAAFPHAGTRPPTASAWFEAHAARDAPAGSFVTRFVVDDQAITCVARFRTSAEGDWLGPDDLAEWDVRTSDRPPAPVVILELSVAAAGATRSIKLQREASGQAPLLPTLRPVTR